MSGRVYAPGRKVESAVWNHFTIDYVKNPGPKIAGKSYCQFQSVTLVLFEYFIILEEFL
jgi:hypothetical protein